MSHRDTLNRAQENGSAYHEFLLHYTPNKKKVYGIVEGKEDPTYYKNIIKKMIPEEWGIILIAAGSKKNVIRAYGHFDWGRYPPKSICFFVDRDLSHFISETPNIKDFRDNIFTTPGYSIENEISNFKTFKILLEDILTLRPLDDKEWDTIESIFNNSLITFSEAMSPIMAQIIQWKRDNQTLNLDNLILKDFFDINAGTLTIKNHLISKKSLVEHACKILKLPPSPDNLLEILENEFRQENGPKKYIRGKYLLWFMIEVSKDIHSNINFIIPRYENPSRLKISIGPANAMIFLGPHAKCSDELQKFIESNFLSHIQDST